ncbi:hypothetical protein JTB14_028298 [Gonioctena quinquepunctata]|nr:hypothetical protein JTB14_028298 [Gonioctena quinquepunctata]
MNQQKESIFDVIEISDDSDEERGPSNAKCRPIAIKEEPKDDDSSSDSTIILDSSIEQRITIQQCISITPKITNRTPTEENEGEFPTASVINGRLQKPEQAIKPNCASPKSIDKNNNNTCQTNVSPSIREITKNMYTAISQPQGCHRSLEKGKENGSAQNFTRKTRLEACTTNSKVASSSKSVSTHGNIDNGKKSNPAQPAKSDTRDNYIQKIVGDFRKALSSDDSESPTPKKKGFAKISRSPVRNNGLQNDKKYKLKPSTSKSGSSDVIEDRNSTRPQNSDANSGGGSAFPKYPSTQKKRNFSGSSASSPNKTIEFSHKKENRINNDYMMVMKDLFSSVFDSPFLKDLIKEETPKLTLIISDNEKYFYAILKLFIWLPKWYNIFRFCEKINLDLNGKEVLELYTFLSKNGIVDVDLKNEKIHNLLRSLDHSSVKSICEKFKVKRTLTTKVDMITALLKFCNTQSTLTFTRTAKEVDTGRNRT